METYLLDKAFLSAGSIGTGLWVRMSGGSPTSLSDIDNRVRILAGSATKGSVYPIGVSITGCSASGKEVIVRLAGIAKVVNAVTFGSVVSGGIAIPVTKGKTRVFRRGAIGSHVGGGLIVHSEGKGSADSILSVLVRPGVY